MALQGDLTSFALPDVLRLLAGSGKTGALEVSTPSGTGEIWFHEGGIVGGAVAGADHVVAPADVVFELLRHDGGSFVFDDEEIIEAAPTSEVDAVLAESEAMVAEWAEVEAVVPSMDAWITLAAEVDAEVTVSAAGWRTIAAIGSGGSVHDLADALGLTDLAASRAVKALAEQGLADVRAVPVHAEASSARRAPEPEAEAFDHDPADDVYDGEFRHGLVEDLAVLGSDERAVVMEVSDDALLPEPLPGEGYSYADEADHYSTVDGPSFDHVDPAPEGYEPFEPVDYSSPDLAAFEPAVVEAAPDLSGSFPDYDAPRPDFLGGGDPAAHDAGTEGAPQDAPVDDDRGSLLKFLSTVKP